MTTVVDGVIKEERLNVSDRCDYCGAQAFVVAKFLKGTLWFCGHHYSKWKIKIDETAFQVVDERARMNHKPGQAVKLQES
jgi:hypothetical protein